LPVICSTTSTIPAVQATSPSGLATGTVHNDDRAELARGMGTLPGDGAYVWHGALHATTVADSLEVSGFVVLSQIIWDKTRLINRARALQIGVSITRAELLVVERDSRVADAQLLDAQKKLALLKAGSRAEDIAEAQAKRDAAAAFLEEGKAELDQCAVRAPAPGTIQVLATIGQFVSVFSPTPLVQLTTDAAAK